MACNNLYTDDEIIAKLKELDEILDEGVSTSELDTGQTNHKLRFSVRQAERQYEKYQAMLQNQNRTLYNCMFGSGATQFRNKRCH